MKRVHIPIAIITFAAVTIVALLNWHAPAMAQQYYVDSPFAGDYVFEAYKMDDGSASELQIFIDVMPAATEGVFYGLTDFFNPIIIKADSSNLEITVLTTLDGYYLEAHQLSADKNTLYILLDTPTQSTDPYTIYAFDFTTNATSKAFGSAEYINDFILTTNGDFLINYGNRVELVDPTTGNSSQTLPAIALSAGISPTVYALTEHNGAIVADVLTLSESHYTPHDLVFISAMPTLTSTMVITGYSQFVAYTAAHTVVRTEDNWIWLNNTTSLPEHTIPRTDPVTGELDVTETEIIVNRPNLISSGSIANFEAISLTNPTVSTVYDFDSPDGLTNINKLLRQGATHWLLEDFGTLYQLRPIVGKLYLPTLQNTYCSNLIDDSFNDATAGWPTEGQRVVLDTARGEYKINLAPDDAALPISPYPVSPNTLIRVQGKQDNPGYLDNSLWGVVFVAENNDVYYFLRNEILSIVYVYYSPFDGPLVLLERVTNEDSSLSGTPLFSAEIGNNNDIQFTYRSRGITTVTSRTPIVGSALAVFSGDEAVSVRYTDFQQAPLVCADQLSTVFR